MKKTISSNITATHISMTACSLAICAGCFCPPVDEKVPTYEMKTTWKNQVLPPSVEQPATPDNWWEVFQDQNLNALVEEGLQNSPTIAQAVARFEQALFLAKVARSDQFPQLSLNGYGDRRRIPADLQSSASVPTGNIITPSTQATIPVPNTGVPPIVVPPMIVPSTPEMKRIKTPVLVNDLIANLLISYEIDFWGKYYLTTQAAVRRAEEYEADLATSRLLLADQIVATYFTIQAMKDELELVREEIRIHNHRNELLSRQVQSGLTDAFQLLDEQATLETLKQDEQSLIQSRDVNFTLLAVLVGREANSAAFEIGDTTWSFPVVPTGIPASLLGRRPDVRTNLKEVEAIIDEIGAAKTELLPAISLSAAAGYQAGFANHWFKWKNRIWDIAASVSQPLFDAGQRFAKIDVTKARYREAAGALTQTVLSAVKEVEDALVAIRTQNERRIAAIKREEDLGGTAILRDDLCTTGVQDYLIVLQAQEDFIDAKRARVNEEYNLQLGTLALMKGLGGSW
jgi:outer membrane protein, multidrug efflux system